MLKKRIITVLAGLALLLAVTGSGILPAELSPSAATPAYACNSQGSGGGC